MVGAFSRNGQELVFLSAYAFMPLLSLAYYVALPPLLGATPGKLALGYMIVGPDGRKIGFGRSLGRYLGYIISAIPLYLGFIWVGIDAYKQGWHDKIAGTYVVRKEFVQDSETAPSPAAGWPACRRRGKAAARRPVVRLTRHWPGANLAGKRAAAPAPGGRSDEPGGTVWR